MYKESLHMVKAVDDVFYFQKRCKDCIKLCRDGINRDTYSRAHARPTYRECPGPMDMVSLFSQVVLWWGVGGITTTISGSSLSEMMDSSPRRGIISEETHAF